ncbi:Rne/Rng family ribonuclease [Thermotalea metallivorans]|uniref:Ribonuclease G n=1 Tax=Thermotalea metallivorans TaxID=520762 RepID=A0A140L923_9FIRM|nr:Rne/Rng family ribonuclease [Thermotalea metallivorans]KXG77048.1 Ribonuclease G [Thermotalea metallivorans]
MNEIIVDSSLNQTRVALMEDRELVEIYVEREDNKRTVGNIYKGRVTNVLPGMQAAFVDIGLEKNAFLYVKDAIPAHMLEDSDVSSKDISIRDVVKNGQEIIVQVMKEPIGTKGARVTTHLTLPGRYLVLMPYVDYIGVSRRIGAEKERERLRGVVEEIKPKNIGVIARTAAEGKEKKELKEDLKFLLKLWQKIDKERHLGFAPRIVYRDLDLLQRTVRDMFTNDIDRFLINDKEKYKYIVDFVDLLSPHLKSRVEYFQSDVDIFDYFQIESMIKNALSRKVWLRSGGYIVIDQTEALTAIDVNTGKYVGSTDLEDTVLKTNIEAAKEIAKQLRLRDIGGIIIVDFIDMGNKEAEKEVLNILEKAIAKDRTKTNILGITQLGLLEMTRKKVRQRIDSILQKKCSNCNGTGKVLSEYTVIHHIEKEVRKIVHHTNAEAVLFEVNPAVVSTLKEENNHFISELEKETNLKIFIKGSELVHNDAIHIRSVGKLDKVQGLLPI